MGSSPGGVGTRTQVIAEQDERSASFIYLGPRSPWSKQESFQGCNKLTEPYGDLELVPAFELIVATFLQCVWSPEAVIVRQQTSLELEPVSLPGCSVSRSMPDAITTVVPERSSKSARIPVNF
jgi:hypothetical protein